MPSHKKNLEAAVKILQKERKQNQKIKQASEQIAIGGTILNTATGTANVTTAVANVQLERYQRTIWNPTLAQAHNRDTPLNKMVIVCATESDTGSDSSGIVSAQDQSRTPYDILSHTPARAIELQVQNDHGILSTSLSDTPSSTHSESLSSQLSSVKSWLSNSDNQDQVVVIQLVNHATTNQDQSSIDELLKKTFGSQLFTMSDYNQAEANGRWPTVNELVAEKKNVVVLASGMDTYNATIPSEHVMTDSLSHHVSAPLDMQWHADPINPAQMDHVIQNTDGQGAFIKLDHLTTNDPRVVSPDMRDKLNYHPKISLFGGWVEMDPKLASTIAFDIGVTSNIGAGAFAFLESSLRAYRNFKFIQDADHHFQLALNSTSLVDMTEYQKRKMSTKSPYPLNLNEEEVIAYCREKLVDKINTDTVTAGALGTTSLAGAVFTFGLLFPPLFPITSILTIVTLVSGTIATSLASFYNRRALNRRIDEILQRKEMLAAILQKTEDLSSSIDFSEADHYAKKTQTKQTDSKLSWASGFLLGTTLVLRLGTMARYVVTIAGTIASGLATIGMYFRSALDAVINYRDRQKHLDNLPKLISQATLPSIDSRRFIFFGETGLEKFLRIHKNTLESSFGIKPEHSKLTTRQLVYELSKDEHQSQLAAIRKAAFTELIAKDLASYCKSHHESYDPANTDLIKNYLIFRVQKQIEDDVLASGRFNTFKIALATWVGGTFFAPVISGLFAGVALVILGVGEVVTRRVSKAESQKFKVATSHLLDKADQDTPSDDPAVAEVASFMHFLKHELGGDKVEDKQILKAEKKTSSTQKVQSQISQRKDLSSKKTALPSSTKKEYPALFKKPETKAISKPATKLRESPLRSKPTKSTTRKA